MHETEFYVFKDILLIQVLALFSALSSKIRIYVEFPFLPGTSVQQKFSNEMLWTHSLLLSDVLPLGMNTPNLLSLENSNANTMDSLPLTSGPFSKDSTHASDEKWMIKYQLWIYLLVPGVCLVPGFTLVYVKAALCSPFPLIVPPHFNCLGTFPVICVLITHNMPPPGSLEALLQASHVTSWH